MRVHLAGDGHFLHNNKDFAELLMKNDANFLLSFFYLNDQAKIPTQRLEWLREEKEKRDRPTRK